MADGQQLNLIPYDVVESHGYGMRFNLTIVSINIPEVQLVRCSDQGGLCHLHQLQN